MKLNIAELYRKTDKPVYSIEILPPRNGTDENKVLDVIREVKPYNPAYVSVTMGSDLTLRGGGLALAAVVRDKLDIEVLAHCTCVRRSREEIENLLTECRYLGLMNILALRGDPPIGEPAFEPHPRGHRYASDLVRQIKNMNDGLYLARETDKNFNVEIIDGKYRKGIATDFAIAVAGHPDGHPECRDYESNFVHLREKQDAGAEYVVTQACYDIDIYKKFLDLCDKHGVTIPIIPGVMPLTNAWNLNMVSNIFKVKVTEKISGSIEKNKNNPAELNRLAIEHTVELCGKFIELGVKGIQFYTLDRTGLLPEIFRRLGA